MEGWLKAQRRARNQDIGALHLLSAWGQFDVDFDHLQRHLYNRTGISPGAEPGAVDATAVRRSAPKVLDAKPKILSQKGFVSPN